MQNYPQFSVSKISKIIKNTLEQTFPIVSVIGEVSNLSVSKTYAFFSVKDEGASLRCVRWDLKNFNLKNGDSVIVSGKITAYGGSSSYQLTVFCAEKYGIGLLAKRFEELKAKLQGEGLFEQKHKKKIPDFAQKIGVISAKNSAGLEDILHHLKPTMANEIHVIFATMQGNLCVGSVIKALKKAEDLELDALIIARGGGSFEDLNAFNSEELARAVFACKIPVISAIGHEVDFTILDFTADARAPTPTASAQIASPLLEDVRLLILSKERAIVGQINFAIKQLKSRVYFAEKMLKSVVMSNIERCMAIILKCENALSKNGIKKAIEHKMAKVCFLEAKIQQINPQNTLNRGYALLFQGGKHVDDASKVDKNFEILTKNGKFFAKKLDK